MALEQKTIEPRPVPAEPALEELEGRVQKARKMLAAAEAELTARFERMEDELRARRTALFPENGSAPKKGKKERVCGQCGAEGHSKRKCPFSENAA